VCYVLTDYAAWITVKEEENFVFFEIGVSSWRHGEWTVCAKQDADVDFHVSKHHCGLLNEVTLEKQYFLRKSAKSRWSFGPPPPSKSSSSFFSSKCGFGPRKKNTESLPDSKGGRTISLYTKSVRLTLRTWACSERVNLYSRQIMIIFVLKLSTPSFLAAHHFFYFPTKCT
jgi:hypothetical protein